jgi:hypothetical protein
MAKGEKTKKPSGSEKRQKALFILARVNEAEKLEVTAKAEKAGMTEGEYVRRQCLTAPTTRAARRPTVETAALAKATGELGKVGSNLNQIARLANSEKRMIEGEIRAVLAEVRQAVAAILAAMGRKPKEKD